MNFADTELPYLFSAHVSVKDHHGPLVYSSYCCSKRLVTKNTYCRQIEIFLIFIQIDKGLFTTTLPNSSFVDYDFSLFYEHRINF